MFLKKQKDIKKKTICKERNEMNNFARGEETTLLHKTDNLYTWSLF